MKLAVLERTFSPGLQAPVTYDDWMQVNHSLDSCLESLGVHWLYSLVSEGGDRSICLFQVSDLDAVREACRVAQMPFQKVWQAELWSDLSPTNLTQASPLISAEVKYKPPLTKAGYEAEKHEGRECFQELNVQHLVSAVALDGTHSICLFTATSAENVRSLFRKVGQPFEKVWKVILIKPS